MPSRRQPQLALRAPLAVAGVAAVVAPRIAHGNAWRELLRETVCSSSQNVDRRATHSSPCPCGSVARAAVGRRIALDVPPCQRPAIYPGHSCAETPWLE